MDAVQSARSFGGCTTFVLQRRLYIVPVPMDAVQYVCFFTEAVLVRFSLVNSKAGVSSWKLYLVHVPVKGCTMCVIHKPNA
jgi:hypothetical protein